MHLNREARRKHLQWERSWEEGSWKEQKRELGWIGGVGVCATGLLKATRTLKWMPGRRRRSLSMGLLFKWVVQQKPFVLILPSFVASLRKEIASVHWRLACHINFSAGRHAFDLAQGPSRVASTCFAQD